MRLLLKRVPRQSRPVVLLRASKLRLLANVLPSMLDQMAKGDMPDERQLRTIAAASIAEQKEVWKAHKPKKNETTFRLSTAKGV